MIKLKRLSKSNLFFLEVALSLILFIGVTFVCIQVISSALTLSEKSAELSVATERCEDIAELVRSADSFQQVVDLIYKCFPQVIEQDIYNNNERHFMVLYDADFNPVNVSEAAGTGLLFEGAGAGSAGAGNEGAGSAGVESAGAESAGAGSAESAESAGAGSGGSSGAGSAGVASEVTYRLKIDLHVIDGFGTNINCNVEMAEIGEDSCEKIFSLETYHHVGGQVVE